MKLDKNIEIDYLAKNIVKFDMINDGVFYELELVYSPEGDTVGVVIGEFNMIDMEILMDRCAGSIPKTIKEHREMQPDRKLSRVVWSKGTGNSSKNSYSTSLYLPISWLREMDLSPDSKDVILEFNGGEITIKKR